MGLFKYLGKIFFNKYFLTIFLALLHCEAITLNDFILRSGKRGQFLEFHQNSTWTVPSGVKEITVTVIGAGGGSSFSVWAGGAGGGGGSCIMRGIIPLISANGGDGDKASGAAFGESYGKNGEKKRR